MKSSFTQLYIHLVFGTKSRFKLPNSTHRIELVAFMAGIILKHKSYLYIGKVMPDHVHLLIGLHPAISVSDIAKDIKANASRHINEMKWVPGKFTWAEGYGAFSCSESVIPKVKQYIWNQEEHHHDKDFATEYKEMLAMSHVKADEIANYWMVE